LQRHPRGIGAATARLLVTGETKPDRLREVAAAGITVLYKPVSPKALRQAIAQQMTRLHADIAAAAGTAREETAAASEASHSL